MNRYINCLTICSDAFLEQIFIIKFIKKKVSLDLSIHLKMFGSLYNTTTVLFWCYDLYKNRSFEKLLFFPGIKINVHFALSSLPPSQQYQHHHHQIPSHHYHFFSKWLCLFLCRILHLLLCSIKSSEHHPSPSVVVVENKSGPTEKISNQKWTFALHYNGTMRCCVEECVMV